MVEDNHNEASDSWFEDTFSKIESNKRNKDSGSFNSIPFGIPALDKHIRIIQGVQYVVSANSGVGKTQLSKFLFVNQPYKFIKENPEAGISLKIMWFALEESKHEFMLTLIAKRLNEEYGIVISVLELMSMNDVSLSEELLLKIKECKEYFEDLSKCLEVIDYISNPFGIFKYTRNYARANGKFYFEGKEVDVNVPGTMFDEYKPNNPMEYVIVVTDNVNILQPEATLDTNTLYGAIGKFSAEYCRKNISKHYGYIPVIVQQQEAAKEKLQFTMKGDSIEQKLEPSLDSLGDNKSTQRDALVVLALFAPNRYNIENHLGYDIKILQDNYRMLILLKNRIGLPNLKCPLYFNGATNTFKQLPPKDSEEMKKMYEVLKK